MGPDGAYGHGEMLAEMGIEPERASAAADLLEALANMSLSEVERADTSGGPGGPGEASVEASAEWERTIDGASSLQEAAQWALYLNVRRGRSILQRAGFLYYRSLGHAFGMYLLVVAGSALNTLSESDFEDVITQLEITSGFRPDVDTDRVDGDRKGIDGPTSTVPAVMLHPQQQVYGLLAAVGEPSIAAAYAGRLRTLALKSPHTLGIAPVGALGTPLRYMWDIAGLMLEGRGDAMERLAVHLTRMAGQYEEAMELARVNQYLWTNCLAPVDVADLHIVGITALAVRRFGDEFLYPLTNHLERLGPVARAPFEIGRSLAGTPNDEGQSGPNSPRVG